MLEYGPKTVAAYTVFYGAVMYRNWGGIAVPIFHIESFNCCLNETN